VWEDGVFPADPYPGVVPPGSFVHVDGATRRLVPGPWRVGTRALDDWLADRDAPPVARRIPVLAYGSNRCPSKITWLRRELGLGDDPVVALKVRTTGVAAVWATGLRYRDGQRPAVLAAAPGVTEEHVIWLATPEQITVLDRCEGRDDRFRLARLPTTGPISVRAEDGAVITDPWCYLGHGAIRRPLLVGGRLVRCADLGQAAARALDGEPAPGDDLDAETVVGAPRPDEWPAALFAYGLLRPGQRSWRLLSRHAAAPPRPARVPGAVFDTGHGYPAWLPGTPGDTPGVIVPLRDPTALFPDLDAYEGPEYRRTRVLVPADGTLCWAYAWRAPTAGLRPLPAGWPP
jgi:gamma-glutamylcyclotransferase (GGCT)/AIG2-like uncharacterized protein YtfP